MAHEIFNGIVPGAMVFSKPFPLPPNGQALTLQLISIPVVGSGTITAQLEASQDGLSFVNINGTAEISSAPLVARQETPIFGSSSLLRAQGPLPG